jgi:hypothetical protein
MKSKKNMPIRINRLVLGLIAIGLFSEVSAQLNEEVDYSKKENWAVLPGNYPQSLNRFCKEDTSLKVDVFYCYPTLIAGKNDARWNVPIDDSLQRKNVLEQAVTFQASAWGEAGRIFVPFYRQAHLRSYYQLENGGREALLFAYEDVKKAFEYYLKNYNNGRPIILAGHSQGSTHLSFILRDFFDGTALQKQLVAAYIPGIGLDPTMYNSLKLMDEPLETGGYVVWNTFKQKVDAKQYAFYKGKAVINPITWDKAQRTTRNQHKGFLFSNGTIYRNSFRTILKDGVVSISIPHFPYRMLALGMKHYHVGDINLFWEDIRFNAAQRVESYYNEPK